jgi:hypothetical protein
MRLRGLAALTALGSAVAGVVVACGARTGLLVGTQGGEPGDAAVVADATTDGTTEGGGDAASESGVDAAVKAGIVTSSSPQDMSIEWVVFTGTSASGDCTADPCTIVGTPAITAVDRTATGAYTLHFATGTFTAAPACTCNTISRVEGAYTYASGQPFVVGSHNTPLSAFSFVTPDASGPADSQGSCICAGPHAPSPHGVTSSSTSDVRVEYAVFSGPSPGDDCSTDPCTIEATPALPAVNRMGTGAYKVQIADGAFSAPPACVCNTATRGSSLYTYASGSPPGASSYVFGTPGPGGVEDSQGSCICVGLDGTASTPQVTTSLPTGLRLESVDFSGTPAPFPGDCTADPCITSGTPAIAAVDRINVGAYQAHFADGGFSAPPACACTTIARGSGGFTYASGEPPILSLYGFDTQGPTGLEDSQGSCVCVGNR